MTFLRVIWTLPCARQLKHLQVRHTSHVTRHTSHVTRHVTLGASMAHLNVVGRASLALAKGCTHGVTHAQARPKAAT